MCLKLAALTSLKIAHGIITSGPFLERGRTRIREGARRRSQPDFPYAGLSLSRTRLTHRRTAEQNPGTPTTGTRNTARTTSTGTGTDISGPQPAESTRATISCETFNCKGFKQSADYIRARLENCDILCLNETWLRPHELKSVESILNNSSNKLDGKCVAFSKSGMTEIDESSYSGRPFGGVTIVCKSRSDLCRCL